jgi:two-component system sensor histidine kinase BaeS
MPLPERGPQEVRLLLRSVNTLVERLRSLEQARRQLLANLVHELGRPLGAFRSAIEALLGGADDEVTLRQELLVGMKDEADRLRRLLDDLSRLYDQVSVTH